MKNLLEKLNNTELIVSNVSSVYKDFVTIEIVTDVEVSIELKDDKYNVFVHAPVFTKKPTLAISREDEFKFTNVDDTINFIKMLDNMALACFCEFNEE